MKTLVKNKSTKRDKTPEIIVSMLKENTGSSILDSGGAYGRNYQRNAKKALKDFENEPVIKGEFSSHNNEIGISSERSVYHFLKDNLSFNEKQDKDFKTFCNEVQNEGKNWLELMEEYPENLKKNGYGITGLYGGGKPFVVNSYNEENNLSQTIQFCYFEKDGESFVINSVHGGCDIRGGYSTPRVFNTFEECNFLGLGRDLNVTCSKDNNHVWVSDNIGYHASFEGQWVRPKLNKKAVLFPDFIEGLPMPEVKKLQEYTPTELNFEEGKAYCPLCWMAEKEKNELTID